MKCLALILVAAVAGAQDAAVTPQQLAQRAVTEQQAGQYAQAAKSYAELERVAPNDVATRVNRGVVLVQLGQYKEAIAEYQAAEKLLPGDARIELNLALAYEKSGDAAQARALFERLHSADEANAQVTMLLADSYLQRQDYGRVIETLQPLKNSADLGVAYMLGSALLRTGHPAEAQAYVDRIAGSGDSAEARFLLGIQAYQSGNFPDAVKHLQSAAEKNAALPGLQSMLGRSLLYTGDPDAALKAFELAGNDDGSAVLGRAEILSARKEDAAARPLVERALTLDPDNARARLVRAELLLRARSFHDARADAEKAAAAMPQDEHAQRILAAVYRAEHLDPKAAAADGVADEIAAAADPGPKLQDEAPGFTLTEADGGKQVRLADYRGKSAVALIFGSYSCPNFRGAADQLKAMGQRYGARIPFLLIYVREAHAVGQWQSGRNQDVLEAATTMTEKEQHASMCSRKLHLPFPALVDGMDGAVETAYNAWPSRAYIVGRDGRVVYSTRLTELEFQPDRMDAVLRKLAGE